MIMSLTKLSYIRSYRFFLLWGWVASEFSHPVLWLGYVWFFGLGCFLVAVGMGGVEFLIPSLCSAMLEGMG
jgi:hypothetical protein